MDTTTPPPAAAAPASLTARLLGTRRWHVLHEFFANSAHFPIANVFYEMLLEASVLQVLLEIDTYIILVAAIVQAWFLGTRTARGRPMPLLGNLVGPAVYTAIEVGLEGVAFFADANHVAYWIFAAAIGLVQSLEQRTGSTLLARGLTLVEHVIRTCIVLVMYGLFERASEAKYATIAGFLDSRSHLFVTIVIPLLGVVIGMAHINAARYLEVLRATAAQLQRYSEWFLGRDLLQRAVTDPGALTLQRQERTVLFMDIRGFTAWSEAHTPEEVVGLVNAYFEAAESTLLERGAIKMELVGDEINALFPTREAAVLAAGDLMRQATGVLQPRGLACGIGINTGPLIEGLVGTGATRKFTAMGDTVNTAKRFCDSAAGGEILLSAADAEALGERLVVGEPRTVSVKGKREPQAVYPLKAPR